MRREAVESYIVRIYRRRGRQARILIGTVEVPGAEERMAFSNVEELWAILDRRKGRISASLSACEAVQERR